MNKLIFKLLCKFKLFRVHEQSKAASRRLTRVMAEHSQAVKDHGEACVECVRETARNVIVGNAQASEILSRPRLAMTDTHTEIER